MAEIAVKLLLERLSSFIVEEGKLLGEFERDVNDIKDDLESMRSFLQDAESRGETSQDAESRDVTDQGVKTWVKQVREVAHDTEDVLDEFLLRLVRPHKQGIIDSLFNKLHDLKHLKTRHRLATEIQNIKARLKAISERRNTFAFTNNGEVVTRANVMPNARYDPRMAALYIDEAEVVGIEVSKNMLIRWLTNGELKLTIVSVVGMGGLGKTTLVKKVFDNQMVNQHFDCRVWVTVSKSPVVEELLRTTIKIVLEETKEQTPKDMDKMDINQLIQVLKNQLSEKRYVIIFDDTWDINVWEAMKFAFPNRDCGSRIIFTTRIGKVAACSDYIHNLEPLEEQEAWRLFCKKAFRLNHDSNSGCPEELEELSRNFLKKCNGLPLAIVLIGGLLSTKAKSVLEWKNIHDSLAAEMRNGYELESINWILLLSYNNLPCHLKPCYLYLGMFPEDYFIKRMKLIRLWIAEGLIKEKQGVTMEVVAGDYVNELISRSMIQIAELNDCNEVKSCRIHDLMREIIQSKCKEECFSATSIGAQDMGYLNNQKARRISIYHNNSTGENNYNYLMNSRFSNIRSLMCFQLDRTTLLSFRRKFFRAFRLLKVLDLEDADLIEFPAELVELIHLRYLSLRRNKYITMIPKSVGKLKNLETLDLRNTEVSYLPVEIVELQRLRHLLVYYKDYSKCLGVAIPPGIGNLTSLQKLSLVDFGRKSLLIAFGTYEIIFHPTPAPIKELGMLIQMRTLRIKNLPTKDGRDLCLALEKMKHLTTLSVGISVPEIISTSGGFLELESLVCPPQLLRHLYLEGLLMRLPVWIASLSNLVRLVLRFSWLSYEEEEDNDPLKAFQHMPNLMHLELNQAYLGEEICCSKVGGYQNLKKLVLKEMERLSTVSFTPGSMPMLRELHIWYCPALKSLPIGKWQTHRNKLPSWGSVI